MKKLLLIFMLGAFISEAQQSVVFCPPGAKWHYNFDFPKPGNPYTFPLLNKTIEYIGDTIIDNETVKILRHDQFTRGACEACGAETTYIKQHGDTVFMKNPCISYPQEYAEYLGLPGNGWQILYNFAAVVDSHWVNYYNDGSGISTHTVTVKGIQTTTINGISLKQLRVSNKTTKSSFSSSLPFQDTIITERIGGAYLFPFSTHSCDADAFNNFLCYQDNTLGLYQGSEKPCDYKTVSVEELKMKSDELKIFPNPATEILNVECEMMNRETEIKIIDLLGREMLNKKMKNGKNEIDVSSLPKGIYFIKVGNHTQKFMKE